MPARPFRGAKCRSRAAKVWRWACAFSLAQLCSPCALRQSTGRVGHKRVYARLQCQMRMRRRSARLGAEGKTTMRTILPLLVAMMIAGPTLAQGGSQERTRSLVKYDDVEIELIPRRRGGGVASV